MNKYIKFLTYVLMTVANLKANNQIELKTMNDTDWKIYPLKPDQVTEVKRVIVESAYELWKPDSTLDQYATRWDFDDLEDLEKNFYNNKGTFLVLVHDKKVIGARGIKKIDNDIAELIRLWFLKEYRGKGLGFKMVNQLLEFARKQGYKKIRLDVYYPELQQPAVKLYKKLRFYEIAPYNNCPAQLWMEKIL